MVETTNHTVSFNALTFHCARHHCQFLTPPTVIRAIYFSLMDKNPAIEQRTGFQ